MTALLTSNLGAIPLLGRGKVRDLYAIDDALLLVASDRISAFDHVLGTGIPGKGKILTQISLFWFDLLSDIVPNHLITADVAEFPAELAAFRGPARRPLDAGEAGADVSVECVARGYLAGSGWKDYRGDRQGLRDLASRRVCRMDRDLPEPLFTPSTKSQDGTHDENISFAKSQALIGADDAAELRRLTLAIYAKAAAHAESRGLILADTKFEFGRIDGRIILADEVLTPDSSRFWEACSVETGRRAALVSTSSSFATISKRSAGTSRRPLRAFPRTWRNARRPNTLRLSGD